MSLEFQYSGFYLFVSFIIRLVYEFYGLVISYSYNDLK